MSEEYDETDEEIESQMQEVGDEDEEEAIVVKKAVKQVGKPKAKQPSQIKDRYVAGHVPEVTFIKDTLRDGDESIIAEGFNDKGVAMAMAKIMNDLDKVITAGGYS